MLAEYASDSKSACSPGRCLCTSGAVRRTARPPREVVGRRLNRVERHGARRRAESGDRLLERDRAEGRRARACPAPPRSGSTRVPHNQLVQAGASRGLAEILRGPALGSQVLTEERYAVEGTLVDGDRVHWRRTLAIGVLGKSPGEVLEARFGVSRLLFHLRPRPQCSRGAAIRDVSSPEPSRRSRSRKPPINTPLTKIIGNVGQPVHSLSGRRLLHSAR